MWSPKVILIDIFTIFLLIPVTSGALDFGGPVEADLTWSLSDSPVTLTSDVRISEGATLTIEYGVEVQQNGHVISSHWPGYPWGYLTAIGAFFIGSGSANENIFIKPDDYVDYCSFWGVRLLLDGNGGTVQNCNFNTGFYGIMVQGEWAIKTCAFEDCAVGIWLQVNVPVSVRNCNFIDGDQGFHFQDLQGFPDLDIRFNNFYSIGYAIFVDGNPMVDFIDARQNYWGDPSGPTHLDNPGGTGAQVGDGVIFDPWLIESAWPISDAHYGLPAQGAALHQNSPNPFNPGTSIAFDLPERTSVSLQIFDLTGRLVRELIGAREYPSGRQETVWNGRDHAGRQVGSGTYFYRLETRSYSETKRMVLVK